MWNIETRLKNVIGSLTIVMGCCVLPFYLIGLDVSSVETSGSCGE